MKIDLFDNKNDFIDAKNHKKNISIISENSKLGNINDLETKSKNKEKILLKKNSSFVTESSSNISTYRKLDFKEINQLNDIEKAEKIKSKKFLELMSKGKDKENEFLKTRENIDNFVRNKSIVYSKKKEKFTTNFKNTEKKKPNSRLKVMNI